MFGLFGSKKKDKGFSELLAEYVVHQQVVGHLSKAASLQKLGRREEAAQVLTATEQMILAQLRKAPRDKQAHLLLAMFYVETEKVDRAQATLAEALNSNLYVLTDEERLVLAAELQKLQRQQPLEQRSKEGPVGFTTIYGCQNCGRLHNFVSMPCPHCDWHPTTLEQTARSLVLSNAHFKIPALLLLAREMTNGRPASDVVPNLLQDGKTYLSVPEQARMVEKVLGLLVENAHKHHRLFADVRGCPNCGENVLISAAEECGKCKSNLDWPDVVRTIACMDNLLWLLEQRSEPTASAQFSEFVCVLVSMVNNLMRKQESPPDKVRQYALRLIGELGAIADLGKGAVIETKNPNQLKIYLVKDSMREDSQDFGMFWYKELEFFVAKMNSGVAG